MFVWSTGVWENLFSPVRVWTLHFHRTWYFENETRYSGFLRTSYTHEKSDCFWQLGIARRPHWYTWNHRTDFTIQSKHHRVAHTSETHEGYTTFTVSDTRARLSSIQSRYTREFASRHIWNCAWLRSSTHAWKLEQCSHRWSHSRARTRVEHHTRKLPRPCEVARRLVHNLGTHVRLGSFEFVHVPWKRLVCIVSSPYCDLVYLPVSFDDPVQGVPAPRKLLDKIPKHVHASEKARCVVSTVQ